MLQCVCTHTNWLCVCTVSAHTQTCTLLLSHTYTLSLPDTLSYTHAHPEITLQHTAIHDNTLQHTATHCNTSPCSLSTKHTATHRNALQHTATHCNTCPLTSPRIFSCCIGVSVRNICVWVRVCVRVLMHSASLNERNLR